MIEQLKKALTTGVGLALKTWAEVEVAGKEWCTRAGTTFRTNRIRWGVAVRELVVEL